MKDYPNQPNKHIFEVNPLEELQNMKIGAVVFNKNGSSGLSDQSKTKTMFHGGREEEVRSELGKSTEAG